MKAAVVEKFGTLVVRDIPKPKPGDYEVLCEMQYGATCTGTDQHLIRGSFPWPISLPAVIGHESVGRVVEIGPKVRNFRLGDLITRVGVPAYEGMHSYWGGYTEFGIAMDHWAMAADGLDRAKWEGARVNQIVPAAVDPRAATMFTTWRETLSFITRMGVGAGASVLVVGSGGNGLSFANHAANLGATRVAMIGAGRLRDADAGDKRAHQQLVGGGIFEADIGQSELLVFVTNEGFGFQFSFSIRFEQCHGRPAHISFSGITHSTSPAPSPSLYSEQHQMPH